MDLVASQPDLVYLPHPLSTKGRQQFSGTIANGESLNDFLCRQSVIDVDDVVVFVNGDLIYREKWPDFFLKADDLVTVRSRLQGDNLSNDQAKTFRTVLTIAILIYTNGMGAEGVIYSIAGIAAVNELIPFPEPDDEEPSPNYSLKNSSNRARPYSPMLMTFGVHRVYPDLGASTYTEFGGDDQYLNTVLHFGIGDLVLSDFKIGDTPLTDFDDYEIEESGPDGALSLFPANVDSQAGGTLDTAAGWITRTSSLDATALVFDLTAFVYKSDDGQIVEHSVIYQIEYRKVGDVTWLPFGESVDGKYTIYGSTRAPIRVSTRQTVVQDQYDVRAKRISADETGASKVSDIIWTLLKTFQPDTGDYTGQKRVALRIRAGGQFNGQIDRFNALVSSKVSVFNDPVWNTEVSSNPAYQVLALARGLTINSKLAAGAGLVDAKIDIESLKAFGDWCDTNSLESNIVFDQPINCMEMLNTIARCGRGSLTWSNGILGVVWDAPSLPITAIFGMSNIRRNTFKVNYNTGPTPDNVVVKFTNPDTGYKEDQVKVAVGTGSGDGRELVARLKGCTSKDQAGREANLLAASLQYRRRQIVFETDMEGAVVQRGDVVQVAHDLTVWDSSGRLVSGSSIDFSLDRAVEFLSGYQHYIGIRYPNGDYDIYDVAAQLGFQKDITLIKPILKNKWSALLAVTAGDEIEPVVFNGLYFTAQNTGTTAATEPTWPLTLGSSVVDGDVTWLASGEAREYAPDDDTDSDGPVDYVWFFGVSASPGKRAKVVDVAPVGAHTLKLTLTDDETIYYAAEFNGYEHTVVNNSNNDPVVSDFIIKDTPAKSGSGYGAVIAISWEASGDYGGAILRAAPTGEQLAVVGSTNNRSMQFPWPVSIGAIDVELVLINTNGLPNIGSKTTATHNLVGANMPISDVLNFAATLNDFFIVLSWDAVIDAHLFDYEIRQVIGGPVPDLTDWDTADQVTRLLGVSHPVPVSAADTYHFMIRARDTDRRELSVNVSVVSIAINAPSTPVVSAQMSGDNVVLNWTASTGDFALAGYRVLFGDTFGTAVSITTVDAISHSLKAEWTGSRTFWVEPVDVAQNAGSPGSVEVTILPGSLTSFTAQVIDNNVLLKWQGVKGTLPIAEFEFRKGDVFSSAEVLGKLPGTFSSHFEDQAGQYRYWLAPIDTAGNYGTESSVLANVDEPPDFILHQEWSSDFSGTKTNIFQMQTGALILPVNTTETFAQHFTNNGWTTPQNQINAGYSFYLEPSLNSAMYEETFDYGTALSGTLITLLLDSLLLDGSVTATPQISVKKLIGDAWTDYAGVWQQYALDFRYVKIRIDFAAAGGNDQLQINAIKLRLAVKQKSDAGTGTAVSTDSGGTVVTFSKAFLDVQSITVTPKGTAARFGIYDFVDTPNPTEFKVLLYDQNGNRQSGDFSWKAEGF